MPKGSHLAAGEKHPRAKTIVTPAGKFGSAALAGKHYGITRQAAAHCARQGLEGGYYADQMPPLLKRLWEIPRFR